MVRNAPSAASFRRLLCAGHVLAGAVLVLALVAVLIAIGGLASARPAHAEMPSGTWTLLRRTIAC